MIVIEDCDEAYNELREQITQAREDLARRGLKTGGK